jgi:DNA-binding HxlR family transcriptional regulator
MADTLREYCQLRGGLGLLVVLKGGPHRFTDLEEVLHVSTSTLTNRLGEARDLGLVTPEIDEGETSVDDNYRITERGQYVVRKMEQLDMVHSYRVLMDMYQQVEAGKEDLVEWVEDEEVKREIARMSDSDPYVDPFGEDVTSS